MKKLKIALAICSFFLIISLCGLDLLNNELKGYTHGVPASGTYVYPGNTLPEMVELEGNIFVFKDEDYGYAYYNERQSLLLSKETVGNKMILYHNLPSGETHQGYYIATAHPNVYSVEMPELFNEGSIILLEKGTLFLIDKEEVLRYEKLSKGLVFVGEPTN